MQKFSDKWRKWSTLSLLRSLQGCASIGASDCQVTWMEFIGLAERLAFWNELWPWRALIPWNLLVIGLANWTFIVIAHLVILILAGIYLFKVSNRNTRTRCEICSKLTIKTPERRQFFLRKIDICTWHK